MLKILHYKCNKNLKTLIIKNLKKVEKQTHTHAHMNLLISRVNQTRKTYNNALVNISGKGNI